MIGSGEGASRADLPHPLCRAFLEVLNGPGHGTRIPLSADVVTLGRGDRSEPPHRISFPDATVSRDHARLVWASAAQRYRLVNISETNVTRVNDLSRTDHLLVHGDEIRLGTLHLRILATSSAPPTVAAEASQRPPAAAPVARYAKGQRRPRRFELVGLFANLSAMLEAGLPLARALSALCGPGASPTVAAACADLLAGIDRGGTLSAAMREQPQVFSPLHVRTVQAGESSGRLARVLGELAAWEERDLALVRTVTGSLTYPLTVFVCGVLVVVVLGNRVFSTLGPTLKASGKPLPLLTRVLCSLSALLSEPTTLAALALVGALVGWSAQRWLRSASGRAARDALLAQMPVFGPLARKLFVGRFCHHLDLLYSNGIPMLAAVQTAGQLAANTWFQARAGEVAEHLAQGHTLVESLEATALFPKLALSIIDVGERSGKLKVLLPRLAQTCDQDVYEALGILVQLLEPAVIVGMGGVVGVIVLGTLLPLYGVITI